jgi:hypothetical protein
MEYATSPHRITAYYRPPYSSRVFAARNSVTIVSQGPGEVVCWTRLAGGAVLMKRHLKKHI